MNNVHDEMVIFHKIPQAKVVLQQNGTLSVHDVYSFHLPFDVEGTALGYLRIPRKWRWS